MPNPFLIDDPDAVPAPSTAGSTASGNPFLVSAPAPSYAQDIASTLAPGAARSAANFLGAPGGLLNAAGQGWRSLATSALEKIGLLTPEQSAVLRDPVPGMDYYKSRQQGLPTPQDLVSGTENFTGPLYKPQTVPGQYVDTLEQFAPGALFGAGSLLQRLGQVAVPAITSETAGQIAHQQAPDWEGLARLGGALAGAGGVALAQRGGTPEAAIGRAMTGVDPTAVQRAGSLMQDAASQGVPLTWDEAIQHATGGATRLSDLRRVVENSSGGGGVLKPLMAERPGQIQVAGDTAIGAIAPNPMDPVSAGVAAQKAAQGAITDTQGAINTATRPWYQAAAGQQIGPSAYQPLATDPLYARVLDEVRGNPALNRGIENLPDNSVAVADLAQRRLREMADNARIPGQASTSNLIASNLEDARTGAIKAADQATGGPTGSYATARLGQSMLRDQLLAPLTEGPVGQVAATNDVLQQGRAVLPNTPAPGSAPVVADTVTQLAMRNPDAAANVLHARLRSAFDEATQDLASGPNQFGGAKFAAVAAGNGQQAQNLEAAIRALPNGDARWDGFRRFLDVMEATGQRPQPGSATAFNAATQQELRGGGLLPEAVAAVKTGGVALVKRLNDFREQMNLGNNTTQIAQILANPNSGRVLERLAAEPPGSQRAAILALRLSYMGRSAARGTQSDAQSAN